MIFKSTSWQFSFLVVVFLSSDLSAAIMHPGSLSVGQKYRYVFNTTTQRDAVSTDISVYDTFVNTAANGSSLMGVKDLTWRVIGSTSSVDAIDHLVDTSGGWLPDSVPIFLLDGTTKVADDFADLWDNDIDHQIWLDESGGPFGGATVWTGTRVDGTRADPLGGPFTTQGSANSTGTDWIDDGLTVGSNDLHSFYAISDVIVKTGPAVPEPASLILGLLCICSLTVVRARYV